jgi:hypothetical protein
MLKKIFNALVALLICGCVALVIVLNYDKISAYIEGRDWSYIEKVADIKGINPQIISGKKELVIANGKTISLYSKDTELLDEKSVVSSGYFADSDGEYSIVVAKDTNTAYLYKGGAFHSKIELGSEVKFVTINKNGYFSVIFAPNGYKSGVKVFSPSGKEQLATYLASSYAVNCVLSEDNKNLYISQIDTLGLRAKSIVKVIEVSKIKGKSSAEDYMKEYELPTDELLIDLDIDKAGVIAYTMGGIYKFNGAGFEKICGLDEKETLLVSINGDFPTVMGKGKEGIAEITIYKEENSKQEFDITPQDIEAYKNKICINFGNEIAVLNTNARILSKIRISDKVEKMHIFDDGKSLAVMYRNKIELFNI